VCFSSFAEVHLGFPGEASASVGIYIKDLSTGKVVAENNADRQLTPASIMKALTAATVMCLVDTSFRFSTPVYLYGHRNGSTWEGNLVIEASGDPSINSSEFPDSPDFATDIVEAMKETGITAITGKVIVNEDLPDSGQPGNWEIEDVPWPYGAGLFGFNFMDNTMRLWPATARTKPFDPGLIVSTQYAKKGSTLIRGTNSDKILAKGVNVRKKSWSINISMPNPARVFSYLLTDELRKAGIKVTGKTTDDISTRMLVAEHHSAPLTDILRRTMVVSHNMFAEAMLRLLAPGCSREEAVEVLTDFWTQRGLDMRNISITGGSGMARPDKLRPRFLGEVLEAMVRDWSVAQSYVNIFPRAGVEGTVKGLMADTPLAGKLALKSGSMSGVQCFAGYKLNDNNLPTHVVVIMVNDFHCSRSKLRNSIEDFLSDTFKQ